MIPAQQHEPATPNPWKYLRGAALTLMIFVMLCAAVDLLVLRPEEINQPETTMTRLWWVGVPVIAVAILFGGRWIMAVQFAQARQVQFKIESEKAQQRLAEARTEQGRREYVLEVISMGVTLDKYRQGRLWEALQDGSSHTTIREQDPKKYPWGAPTS